MLDYLTNFEISKELKEKGIGEPEKLYKLFDDLASTLKKLPYKEPDSIEDDLKPYLMTGILS